MKISLIITIIFINVGFNNFTSYSQIRERKIRTIGFDVGLGAATYDLSSLNNYLRDLDVGLLESEFASRTFSLNFSSYHNIAASLDVNFGTSFESSLNNPGNYLNMQAFSIGGTGFHYLLNFNRVKTLFFTGFRFNTMFFDYNSSTNTNSSFSTLIKNPNFIRLSSDSESFLFGGRFQYRLGKKVNLKPREYLIGIDSGYNFGFRNSGWREVGNRNIVPDMPTLKPNNWYLHLTFSGYFNFSK